MAIATYDRTPPPFFRQGPSARTKLLLCSALALFLMAADNQFTLTQPLRAALATTLLPLQRALRVPADAWQTGADYLRGLEQALNRIDRAEQRLAQQAERSARADQLAGENARLRALLDLRPAMGGRSVAAEVLYEAPDPYSRKVFIDRGATHGVAAGSPAINENGVLGQVTRSYPLSAEVTLLVDENAAIPVLNARTGQRSAAFGVTGGGAMELRFMAGNADIQVGDLLVTSGSDGVYPGGLAVAKIIKVDRRADSSFARVTLAPAASPDGVRHLLVLEPVSVSAQAPASAASATDAAASRPKPARPPSP
jgi:rod shape-determining protein MreC